MAPLLLPHFEPALARMAESGLGPARARLRLEPDAEGSLVSIDLDAPESEAVAVEIEFRTPTELKAAGDVAECPTFATVFARLRDRVATLAALYGAAPLTIDFRGLGARAAAVEILRRDTASHRVERTSTRTGQTHPIGGFTGVVMYAGELTEFLPWLRAGEYSGVGRQTSWGKGEIRVRRIVPRQL
jgi:CRISPR/Cas system endoribonuclease Cas6 (RAMP superfamily)